MGVQRTPQLLKLRRIRLMRIAFTLLLIGNGILIFTSLVLTLNDISEVLGDPSLDWVVRILTFSKSLTQISFTLSITGGILLLLTLAKIGENSSLKLKSTSKIAFLLLICSLTLNFAFTYVLSSLELWGLLNNQAIDQLLSITPLITIGVDSAFYIFLGFTIRVLRSDHNVGDRPLITTFLYPISFALRLLLMFDIFSSEIVRYIASLIVSVLGLVILLVFFSTGLLGLKKVKNKIAVGKRSRVLPSRRDGKYCANCGEKIASIASFCASCGHPIE